MGKVSRSAAVHSHKKDWLTATGKRASFLKAADTVHGNSSCSFDFSKLRRPLPPYCSSASAINRTMTEKDNSFL